MKRVLLLMPTTTYKASAFLEAARSLGVEVVVGTEKAQALAADSAGALALEFDDTRSAVSAIVEFAGRRPIDAVVPTDDETTVLAAAACEVLGLPGNSPESARCARDKALTRSALARAAVPSPSFRVYSTEQDAAEAATQASFPCVLKPVFLSASRGVIRANDRDQFIAAFERIRALLQDGELARRGGEKARQVIVETFVPGREVALEGLLTGGRLQTLASFDKPDSLDGPFFEETIYVTPSRLGGPVQDSVTETASMAARALGLRSGPVHAELRVNDQGAWLIEMAARSIGGLCSRALRFGVGITLEELILRHATGADISLLRRERRPAGVMMIPIPRAGLLRGVSGRDNALSIEGIEDVVISIPLGHPVVPLPEGNRYLGFIFARGETPERVEGALREAHRLLLLTIE